MNKQVTDILRKLHKDKEFKPGITITKTFKFEAAHRLTNPSVFTPEEEKEIFHACSREHGHSFSLEVSVRGQADNDTGFVLDFKQLKKTVNNLFVEKEADHYFLNENIAYFREFKDTTVTVENLLVYIATVLLSEIPNIYSLKMYETATGCAELDELSLNWIKRQLEENGLVLGQYAIE